MAVIGLILGLNAVKKRTSHNGTLKPLRRRLHGGLNHPEFLNHPILNTFLPAFPARGFLGTD